MALRIWNTHKADAFNSPDPCCALWADLKMILCAVITQSKGWDSKAPAAPLFWVLSTFGLFHYHLHLVWAKFRGRFHNFLIAVCLLNSTMLAVWGGKKKRKSAFADCEELGKFHRNISLECCQIVSLPKFIKSPRLAEHHSLWCSLSEIGCDIYKLSFTALGRQIKQEMQSDQL